MNVSYAHAPGDTMPNGTIIIEEIVTQQLKVGAVDNRHSRRESIVLALRPGGVDPYITWSRWITTDPDGRIVVDDTTYGHYHRHIDKAVRDFKARTRKEKVS